MDKVKAALAEDVTMQPWRMHIFQQQPYPQDYTAFKRQRGKAQPPFERPEKLPALPAGLHLGEVPSVDELQAAVKAAFEGKQTAEVSLPCTGLDTVGHEVRRHLCLHEGLSPSCQGHHFKVCCVIPAILARRTENRRNET